MKKTSLLFISVVSLTLVVSLSVQADFLGIGKALKKGYQEVEKAAKKGAKAVKETAEDIGKRVEKAGGVVSDVGVKVGNATIKTISKAGEVTLSVAGRAGDIALKAGQVFVTTTGLVMLNTGGMLWALTTGDLTKFKDCALAVDQGMRYGVSTVIDETLKTVGSVDHIIKITNVSIEASSSELALQGKTPKMSVSGSFWGRDFNLNNVQLDLSRPDLFATDLLELLVQLKIG